MELVPSQHPVYRGQERSDLVALRKHTKSTGKRKPQVNVSLYWLIHACALMSGMWPNGVVRGRDRWQHTIWKEHRVLHPVRDAKLEP